MVLINFVIESCEYVVLFLLEKQTQMGFMVGSIGFALIFDFEIFEH